MIERRVALQDVWHLDSQICVPCQFSRTCSMRDRRVRDPERFLTCSTVKEYLQQNLITVEKPEPRKDPSGIICDNKTDACPASCRHSESHTIRECQGLCPKDKRSQRCSPKVI